MASAARSLGFLPRLTLSRLLLPLAVAGVYAGWRLPTERYITPERGWGYALGIVGGSCMVLLLLYSARKRIAWLRPLGPTGRWFEIHMLLGVVGPLCILFHSNFNLGAVNSNVALLCMLTVAGSGFIGRYLYARMHFSRRAQQLFSIWHLLHMPLVFMMFAAAAVHIVAVHVY